MTRSRDDARRRCPHVKLSEAAEAYRRTFFRPAGKRLVAFRGKPGGSDVRYWREE